MNVAANLFDILRPAIATTLVNAINNPSIPLSTSAPGVVVSGVASDIASDAASKAARELAPVVEHVTNQEPWYQSRVTWGAILAAAAPLLGLAGYAFTPMQQELALQALVTAGSLAGAGLTLYGRWKARKPIGA